MVDSVYISVYPREGTTYPDASGTPVTAAGATVDTSKYIRDAIRAGFLLTWDPLGIYQPEDRTTSGGSSGDGSMLTAANIPALRSLLGPSNGAVCELLGYNSLNDGGGGTFYWTVDTTQDADDVLVIGNGPGRWLRQYDGKINVKWFGAKGDGVTDDTYAIQQALNYANALVAASTTGDSTGTVVETVSNRGRTVFIPAGVYVVSATGSNTYKLALRNYVTLEGEGYQSVLQSALNQNSNARTLSSDAPGATLIDAAVRNLRIYGRETEQPAAVNYQRAGIFIYNSVNFQVTDCWIHDTGDCIRMFGPLCSRTYIARNHIYDCPIDIGREVIQMEGVRDSIVSDNFIYDCPFGYAIKMENAEGASYHTIVSNNQIRNCGGGITVGDGVTVTGNTIDCIYGAGVQCSSRCLVANNRINSSGGAGIFALNVTGRVEDVSIQSNVIKEVKALPSSHTYGIATEIRVSLPPRNIRMIDNEIAGVQHASGYLAYGCYFEQIGSGCAAVGNRIANCSLGVYTSPGTVEATEDFNISNNSIVPLNSGRGISVFGLPPTYITRRVLISGNIVNGAAGSVTGVLVDQNPDRITIIGNQLSTCATPISTTGTPTNSITANNQV